MTAEYRVVWQREGGNRPKVRRYVRRERAEQWLAFLTGDPHSGCEDHFEFCVWDRWAHQNKATEPPPWRIEPRMEVREVGPWGLTLSIVAEDERLDITKTALAPEAPDAAE